MTQNPAGSTKESRGNCDYLCSWHTSHKIKARGLPWPWNLSEVYLFIHTSFYSAKRTQGVVFHAQPGVEGGEKQMGCELCLRHLVGWFPCTLTFYIWALSSSDSAQQHHAGLVLSVKESQRLLLLGPTWVWPCSEPHRPFKGGMRRDLH